jgi:pimeloyl-ACP methyl ester carboxylesterase
MSRGNILIKFVCSFLFVFLLFSGQLALAQNEVKKSDQETKKEEKQEEKKDETKIEKKDGKIVVTNPAKGRLPVIVIPGLIGSELINKNTKEKVWFDLGRSKDDDLRLPISTDLKANRDSLIPGDILRKIQLVRFTPEIEIYQKLLEVLQKDGFTEGKIDDPQTGGDADTFYVFPYDWRLDNVESAQTLLRKMDEIRTKLNRPDLKFNVIGHSMGGLIARYAAMYGSADLTARTARPTWKGASYINSISMVATPNAGALSSLDSLLNGFSLFGSGKLNLPFIQNITKYDLFTIPSVYQLLPHPGTARAFDENLKPLKVDLFSPATWEKYGWITYTDEEFIKKFNAQEQAQAKAYFRVVLQRAKLFHSALDASSSVQNPIPMHYLGAECRQTIDGMIIRRDTKKGIWKTDFGTSSYTKSNGEKVTKEQTEAVLLSPGDGVVPKRSLISSFLKLGRLRNIDSNVIINGTGDSCDEHNRLTGNETVVKNLLGVLNNSPNKETNAIKASK